MTDQMSDRVDACELHNAVVSEASAIMRQRPRVSVGDADRLAEERVEGWYRDCEESLDIIRIVGLARWVSSHRRACVWATLAGLKAKGIKELPI